MVTMLMTSSRVTICSDALTFICDFKYVGNKTFFKQKCTV